jgi:hypothetical protein
MDIIQRIVADRIPFMRRFGRGSAAAAAGLSVKQITKKGDDDVEWRTVFQMISSPLDSGSGD